MVSGLRTEGAAQVLSAGVRKTIQSIKEIVGNHSDADIYVALKETDMDPNETAQKLLNQDPFHEVKRKRDKKKESSGYKTFVAAEPKKNTEIVRTPAKYSTYEHTARRGVYGRNVISNNLALSDAGASREFRVVRDNRVIHSANSDAKPVPCSTPSSEEVMSNGPVKSDLTGTSGHPKPPVGRHSYQAVNALYDSQLKKVKDVTTGDNDTTKEFFGEKRLSTPIVSSQLQTRTNDSIPYSENSHNSSVVGVYSSSSDPVHVPSHHPRPAANVGAIKREVGVVGPRRLTSEKSAKPSSFLGNSFPNSQSGKESHSKESARPFNGVSRSDQYNQDMPPESSMPVLPTNKSFPSNSAGNRSHVLMGHQKASQPNKEWKPKSILKPSGNTPVVVEAVTEVVSPPIVHAETSSKKDTIEMEQSMSQLNISDNQNVIIAAHIRVSEADRSRLTFGSLGPELDSSRTSVNKNDEDAEGLSPEPSGSVSVSNPEISGDKPTNSNQLLTMDDSVQSSGFDSSVSGTVSDHQLLEKKESSNIQSLDNYADAGLVGGRNRPYTPELLQQDTDLSRFSGYDPHVGYDMPYFQPLAEETVRGSALPSSQEVLSSHLTNTIPASTIAMVQQQHQHQQMTHLYPQLHVSHFSNLMPYRQFLSPVYVPPMPVPGYANSPAYPHPSNGSSYVLMPGNGSHLSSNGLKYGIQQFKPVPAGGPTGYGNFTSPTGYAINTPGVVTSSGHEDSFRVKYNDSLYVPNLQAETSEHWMNPRDLPSVQSASYYNLPGQTPHAAFLPSHAAAAAQSSHMQFPGLYHPAPQPAAIASPHPLGPAIGGNVGVGVAAPSPGAQVGAYHQPQLGHSSWTVNF